MNPPNIRPLPDEDSSDTSLVRYDAACRALAEAKCVDEVKDVRDRAVGPIFVLRMRSLRGDDIKRLRWLLMALLRQHGWRCLSVEVEHLFAGNSQNRRET